MSNSNQDANTDDFLVTSIEGLPPEPQPGLPLGYAYLIRSSVRMPELYPLLGELVFGSFASNRTEGMKTNNWSGVNVICMFVDDKKETLFLNLGSNLNLNCITDDFLKKYEPSSLLPQTAAWMDTFGQFGNRFEKIEFKELAEEFEKKGGARKKSIRENIQWFSQSTLGAGNPMSMFRFVRQTQKILQDSGKGKINLYMLNSLSSLYRNLGLSETSAFLKEVLNNCIWSGEQPGLFFAVLQEGVMSDNEVSYISSFFDGIIHVRPEMDKKRRFRVPAIEVESLPETIRLPEKIWYLPLEQEGKFGKAFEKLENTFFINAYREIKKTERGY